MIQHMKISHCNLPHKQNERKKPHGISDAEKAFNNIQYPIIIKVLERVRIKGTYLNIIKVTADL